MFSVFTRSSIQSVTGEEEEEEEEKREIQNSKNLGLAFEKGRERGENKNSLVHEDIINPRENRRGERRKNDSAGYFVLE